MLAPQIGGWGWTLAILAMILLGGTEQHYPPAEGLAEAIAALTIAAAIGLPSSRFGALRFPDWIALALVALAALQLVPLPPALWTALPGRELAAEIDLAVFGAPRWRPVSLDPLASLRSFAVLLPAFAAYLALRTGDGLRRKAVLRGVALALGAALALAALQAASGQAAWTYPYAFGQTQFLTGFFSNHNHHGDFLLAAFPLAILWGVQRSGRGFRPFGPSGLVSAVLAAIVAIFVVIAASRASASLIPLALGGTALAILAPRFGMTRHLARILAAGAASLAALFGLMLLLGGSRLLDLADRTPLSEDLRRVIWPNSVDTALAYFPFGSGIGTFAAEYARHEPLPTVTVFAIEHAHSDYLEILCEAGLAGALLLAIALGGLALRGWQAWFGNALADPERLAPRLACVALAIPLVHSLVDYPLRTISVSILFAIAAAILCRAGSGPVALDTTGARV